MAISATVASAQLLQRNPVVQQLASSVAQAPMAKVLGPNQLYMGPYTSDELGESGLGLSNTSGVFKQGTLLPLGLVSAFEGGQVKAIRFGLCAPVTDDGVFIYPVTSLSPLTVGEPLVEQLVESTVAGWNEVVLDAPVTISADGIQGLLIGYQYRQKSGNTTDCYPISVVESETVLPSYTYAPGVVTGWEDIGLSSYGNLSVQAIVEKEYSSYSLALVGVTAQEFAKNGQNVAYNLGMANIGTETLSEYTVDVLIDGEVKATVDSPIALTPSIVTYAGTCPVEGLTTGQHTLTLRVATVAGEQPAAAAEVATSFVVYQRDFPRQKQLVEHFTSTTCTYCPLGMNVLKALEEICQGSMVRASVHVNIPSSGDPFVITKGTQLSSYLGVNSAPSAVFNRFDAEMTGALPQTISYNAQYAQMAAQMFKELYFDNNPTPALASINIEPTYNESTRKLAIKVSGELSEDFSSIFGSTMGLTVYVTEDSLVARQLNQGTWVTGYVHDNVVRAIPSAYNGDLISVGGKSQFEKGYSVTFSSSWNPEKMHIIALLHRRGNGVEKQVINCEMVPLLDPRVPGDVDGNGSVGIEDVNAVINVMLGKAENALADVDGNGSVGIEDVNAVINIMLGK